MIFKFNFISEKLKIFKYIYIFFSLLEKDENWQRLILTYNIRYYNEFDRQEHVQNYKNRKKKKEYSATKEDKQP